MIHPYPNLQALMSAALVLKAKTVVELGTGNGCSADAFLAVMKVTDGILYSIDLHPESPEVKETLNRLKEEPRFVFIHSDSVEAGRNWNREFRSLLKPYPIDILYVDSDHTFKHVLDELLVWGQLNPKVIFIHDILNERNEKWEPYFACEEYARRTGKMFFAMEHFPSGLGVFINL